MPELIELNHLKNSIPPSCKDRLYEIETLKEAWAILEKKNYGKSFDLRNRLKQEFLGINISARTSPLIEIEIYEKVHKLASRIRAAKAQNLLDSDFEYISIIHKLLPENQKEKWVTVAPSNPTWESFYSFLEGVYDRALLKKQINESCKQKAAYNEEGFCTNCNISGYIKDNCSQGNILATLVEEDCCPICNDLLHIFEMPMRGGTQEVKGTRLLNCD